MPATAAIVMCSLVCNIAGENGKANAGLLRKEPIILADLLELS